MAGRSIPAYAESPKPGAAAPPATTAPATAPSLAEWFWPIGLRLPENLMERKPPAPGAPPAKGDVLVWLPPDAKRIRAMLLIPNNSDSMSFGSHRALREVATKHEMAVVYLRNFEPGIEHRKTAPEGDRIAPLMQFLVESTGVAEFRYAPWITFGKSSRGEFPFRMAWLYPDRTIASISYHGETPSWPPAEWAKLKGQTILEVNANGETEWGGTWFNHVRPSLLNYRARAGWLAHQAVVKGVGHGNYPESSSSAGLPRAPPDTVSRIRVWDYLSLFVDKAISLRVPKDKYPTDGPLELKQVDEAGGYLIDPFAVEEMFHVPHLPLREGPDGYLVGDSAEAPVSGFAAMAPLKDFKAPESVPVVQYESAKSPKQWLVTDSLKFLMKADPILELGDLAKLMPKPGDEVTVDGTKLTFQPIAPGQMGPNGGIALGSLRGPGGKLSLLAYTVMNMPERKCVRVRAGYTAGTRTQMVINGVPVRHKQVLDLQPGQYPVLVALRMAVFWDRIEPGLEDVPDAEVAQAQQMQEEADKLAAEQAKLKAAGQLAPKVLIQKAAGVPKEKRAKMFWVADKELADAWLKLHTIPGK